MCWQCLSTETYTGETTAPCLLFLTAYQVLMPLNIFFFNFSSHSTEISSLFFPLQPLSNVNQRFRRHKLNRRCLRFCITTLRC